MESIAAINATPADPLLQATSDGPAALGQDAFLQLLVAQLRYQDPMSPADSQSFLAQTAQFTTVEKLEEIAEAMSSLTRNDELTTIGTLVGSTVSYVNEYGDVAESLVTAGRTTEDGIMLVLGDRELHIDDVIAILATPSNP